MASLARPATISGPAQPGPVYQNNILSILKNGNLNKQQATSYISIIFKIFTFSYSSTKTFTGIFNVMLLTSLKVSTGHVNKAWPDPAHQYLSPARPEARLFFKIFTRQAGCPWASPTCAGL
jgi:hypothetical protein